MRNKFIIIIGLLHRHLTIRHKVCLTVWKNTGRSGTWISLLIVTSLSVLTVTSCNKLLSVPSPTSQITADKVFNTDKSAASAMAGVYTNLISGNGQDGASQLFAAGLCSFVGGLSADELIVTLPNNVLTAAFYTYNTNHIIAGANMSGNAASSNSMYSDYLWSSAYSAIYEANAVIEGIAASKSASLHDSVRTELTAEAQGIRAFCYFYLVNLFGDIPLLTDASPISQQNLPRTPKEMVYDQIIKDLQAAQNNLPADFSLSSGQRLLFTKWAASALLARVYLYNKDYKDALKQASAVIGSDLFGLESDLNRVFLTTSREAIWQLQQNVKNNYTGNAVPETASFLPIPLNTGMLITCLSQQLLASFEPGDMRRRMWIDSTIFDFGETITAYFPFKYKTGLYNSVVGGTPSEYYMVLRLAEQYLIRAEAEASLGNMSAAIADVNILRKRAGLPELDESLSQTALLAAIAHERQTELFCEWGQRWLDLKRTDQAHAVLSAIKLKQPWQGDYQLLYPLPYSDLLYDSKLVQNPGY